MMDSMRLQRRPDGSVVIGVWYRILFHEVPGGNVSKLDRGEGGAGEVRASWGPLILVSRHWADVGVRVRWEPDSDTSTGYNLRIPTTAVPPCGSRDEEC